MAPLFKMFGTLVILGEPKMSLVCDLSGKFIENVSVSVWKIDLIEVGKKITLCVKKKSYIQDISKPLVRYASKTCRILTIECQNVPILNLADRKYIYDEDSWVTWEKGFEK